MQKYAINVIYTIYILKKKKLTCFKIINKILFLTINAIKMYYTKQLNSVKFSKLNDLFRQLHVLKYFTKIPFDIT